MYESFYGLTEKPFTLLPDPDYLYLSPKHQRALTLLEYGMMNQAGFSVICGDTGAGKTTLIRRLLTELGDDTTVGLITNTHQSFGDLLHWVLMAFGIESEGKSKSQMHQMFINFLIEQYAKNMHTVLIVDEAQNMNAETLEELRMLSNINADKDQVLQVILAGQPALRDTLRKPELMQFAQRISVDYYLESLSKDETREYIGHRLTVAGAERGIFTKEACDAIYRYSGGTPRLINLLCDTALVYGFAEQTNIISVQLVDDVVREQHSNSIVPTFNKPLSDEDIDKLEKETTVQQVIEPAKADTESVESKNDEEVYSEINKLSNQNQAVSNSDAMSRVELETEAALNVNKVKPIEEASLKEKAKHSEASKVTPIKQDLNDGKAESDHSNIDESIDDIFEDSLKIKADELAAKETGGIGEHEISLKNKNVETSLSDDSKDMDLESSNNEDEIVFENFSHKTKKAASSSNNDTDEIYPIIHVEDNSKKNIKVLVLGFIIGLFLASAISIGGAYLLFVDKSNNELQYENAKNNFNLIDKDLEKKSELEKARLEALEKERDAALAISKALERERDAALATAKVQEDMRNTERRVAEIIAEQERKSSLELKRATMRARKAELEAAKAKEREHQAKMKAINAQLESREKANTAATNVFTDPVANVIKTKPVAVKRPASTATVNAKMTEKDSVRLIEENIKKETKKSTKFSANPCSSPSAKFLSTCKK